MAEAGQKADISETGEGAPQDLPTTPDRLFEILDKLGIIYQVFRHKAIFTVAEGEHLKENIPGLHCRNLFLRDRKKRMFLVVAANETAIDLKKLPSLIGSDRLSFGSRDRLWEFLGIRPGSVCPFCIINDNDNKVELLLDKSMMEADTVNYHPLDNAMTIGLTPEDLIKFIKYTGHEPRTIDLAPAAPDNE